MKSPSTVFELRTDPTTGRKVLIAEGRALRPNDFAGESVPAALHPTRDCPFCKGNEHATPHELAVVSDAAGDWQVRVVPNKYPAVAPAVGGRKSSAIAATDARDLRPPLAGEPPLGVHEVIIESPRHVRDWAELSTEELATVLCVFRDRVAQAYAAERMTAALVFKNVGQAAGASLEHVHSQLIALPQVPDVLDRELQLAAEHHQRTGGCLMCQLVAAELDHGTRIVDYNGSFVAFTAYAGRQPYETWIVPQQHQSSFTHLADEESRAHAAILGSVVRQLSNVLAPLAYNVVLHTAAVGDSRSDFFHWHWELIPRTTSLAGFEWGTGMYINSVSPERAAICLAALKSGQELPIQ